MLLIGLGKDEYIINKDETLAKFAHTLFHQALERGWSVAETKTHAFALVEAQVTDGESSLLLILLLLFLYLPVI